MNVSLIYKCRSCGKEFSKDSLQPAIKVTHRWEKIFFFIRGLWEENDLPKTAVHTCKLPRIGIADLIACVPDVSERHQ